MADIIVTLGPKLFDFPTFGHWVNYAPQKWKSVGVRPDESICLDAKNRPVRIGRDFMKARDENAFPVTCYLMRGDLPEYAHLNAEASDADQT